MKWGRTCAVTVGLLATLHGSAAIAQQQPQPVPGDLENPLVKILQLMEKVEDRLYGVDTGKYTQEEQKQIVEALRFEAKTQEALQALIEHIENQPP